MARVLDFVGKQQSVNLLTQFRWLPSLLAARYAVDLGLDLAGMRREKKECDFRSSPLPESNA
jgi:hypothetical protein